MGSRKQLDAASRIFNEVYGEDSEEESLKPLGERYPLTEQHRSGGWWVGAPDRIRWEEAEANELRKADQAEKGLKDFGSFKEFISDLYRAAPNAEYDIKGNKYRLSVLDRVLQKRK